MNAIALPLRTLAAAALTLACMAGAWADDAAIRKAFAERNPKFPPIDEITKTPINGLYEVRIGTEIMYVDDKADYIMFPEQGHIIETKSKTDLTEARLNKLTAIDVPSLPFKDAIMIKQGTGARRLVVFEDPNCGYCKQLERDLVALKDVTIYTFLMPILGPDSTVKARDIWCAHDNAKAWRGWMLTGITAPREMGKCDFTALDRNTELGRRFRIQGTPAVVFEDGSRVPGVISLDKLEQRLAAQPAPKKG